MGIIVLLSLVVFPARRLAVTADGQELTLVTRQQDVAALLDAAGVQRGPGDVFVQSNSRISVERAMPVAVRADGRTLSWRTRATNIAGVLSELGLSVTPYDRMFLDGREVTPSDALEIPGVETASRGAGGVVGAPSTADGLELEIKRAVPVTLAEDGVIVGLQSSRETVEDVLRDVGVKLGPADDINPAPSTPVSAGMRVEVEHANAISLTIGSSSQVIYTHQKTLEAALAEAGLTFGSDDRVEPPLDATVNNGMQARVVRVSGRTILEKEPVKHVTVFKPDDSLSGTATRRVEGSDGVHVLEYHVRIEDGQDVEKRFVKEYFDPEPVNTVIYFAASALESSGFEPTNLHAAKTLRMYATWYNAASSGKAATDSSYGITHSGAALTKGIVAVDPSVIPLGTRLFIPGYGFAIAGDTGGGIKGNMVDLGFPDGVPIDWNTGWTDVYVLAP